MVGNDSVVQTPAARWVLGALGFDFTRDEKPVTAFQKKLKPLVDCEKATYDEQRVRKAASNDNDSGTVTRSVTTPQIGKNVSFAPETVDRIPHNHLERTGLPATFPGKWPSAMTPKVSHPNDAETRIPDVDSEPTQKCAKSDTMPRSLGKGSFGGLQDSVRATIESTTQLNNYVNTLAMGSTDNHTEAGDISETETASGRYWKEKCHELEKQYDILKLEGERLDRAVKDELIQYERQSGNFKRQAATAERKIQKLKQILNEENVTHAQALRESEKEKVRLQEELARTKKKLSLRESELAETRNNSRTARLGKPSAQAEEPHSSHISSMLPPNRPYRSHFSQTNARFDAQVDSSRKDLADNTEERLDASHAVARDESRMHVHSQNLSVLSSNTQALTSGLDSLSRREAAERRIALRKKQAHSNAFDRAAKENIK